jgi:hydroxymethylpyrimidine/phosphomethylpyrimidine kinase
VISMYGMYFLDLLIQTLTGMLASAEIIAVVADALERHNVLVTVIDPVGSQ